MDSLKMYSLLKIGIFIAMLAYWSASLGGVPKMWFTVEQKQSLHVYEGNPVKLHYPLVRVFGQHAMYRHVCKFESPVEHKVYFNSCLLVVSLFSTEFPSLQMSYMGLKCC